MATWVDEAAAFFAALEEHNDRDWWTAHRRTYDEIVRPSFLELVEGLEGFGAWRVYRPNNDVRFANKDPYKTFIGAVAERSDGVGAFVQVGVPGLRVGTGAPMLAKDQLVRWREAIAADDSGAAFVDAAGRVRADGGQVTGGRWEPLRRVPRGFDGDHPREEQLRWKGLEIGWRPGSPTWVADAGATAELQAIVDRGASLHAWLAAHVGPTAMTPEERFGGGRSRR